MLSGVVGTYQGLNADERHVFIFKHRKTGVVLAIGQGLTPEAARLAAEISLEHSPRRTIAEIPSLNPPPDTKFTASSSGRTHCGQLSIKSSKSSKYSK